MDGGCWASRRGYGRFLREAMCAIAGCPGRHQYTLILDRTPPADLPIPGKFDVVVAGTEEPVASAARADGRRGLRDLARMARAAARVRYDVFFFPTVYSYFPLLRRAPMVLGIHDAIADRNPAFSFPSKYHHGLWRAKNRLALKQADRVVTVSGYAARCITQSYSISPSMIRVVPEAPAACFRPAAPTSRSPYFIAVGGLSPNKNLLRLVLSYSRTQACRDGVELLLVGDDRTDAFLTHVADIRALIDRLNLSSAVRFCGFVPDSELPSIYSGAVALLMPSLDEGFGLPAVEAMACGTAVIASTGTSLEEVVSNAGILVNPEDEAQISAAIDRIYLDQDLRRQLRSAALQRAQLFTWAECAAMLERVFEEFA